MCAIGRLRLLSQNHSTAHIEPTGLKYSLRGSDRQVGLIKVAYTRLNFAENGFIPAGEKFFSDSCCRFSDFVSESQFRVGGVSVFPVSCRREDAGNMTTETLLDTELMYLTEEGTSVATTVGAVDSTRLSKGLPVRSPRSYARQRHYPGLFWSATTNDHIPFESRLELDRLWLADFEWKPNHGSGQSQTNLQHSLRLT